MRHSQRLSYVELELKLSNLHFAAQRELDSRMMPAKEYVKKYPDAQDAAMELTFNRAELKEALEAAKQ